jgi:hypothetical protein
MVRSVLRTYVNGCETNLLPSTPAISPRNPLSSRFVANAPKRRARTLSKTVGEPPRCKWPKTKYRQSNPVFFSMKTLTSLARAAPSATTMIELFLPLSAAERRFLHMSKSEYGTSGMRIASAPPARPDSIAIKPYRVTGRSLRPKY